ncbi:MAG: NAD(P)/FAD-dependent oxidoreductase [Alphaproteobacteria bacterium]|nr:NAD(P)/FAD-dependent oxidoreductase [Alphaproteobacteria bacterium]
MTVQAMSDQTVQETDVVIVGAGPVGLFAVFELGMLKIRAHVVDSLEEIGGQCTALYPEKPIFDIPAWPRIEGAALIEKLEEQAAPFHPTYHLNQQVVAVERRADGGFLVETSAGARIACTAIVIAAGGGAFGPNRPPLEGLSAYEGSSVFYMVKRREDFRGKRIVIAGGGDSAVDWALSLPEVAEKVYVVHRRDKFRAAPESVERMLAWRETGKLELIVPYQLAGLEGADGRLAAVLVKDLDGTEKRLEADVLLPFFGLAAKLGPIADWGFPVEKHTIPVNPATCETPVAGIFAIGDVATYPGKLKLILQGFSDAAQAAHAIHPLVHPGEALHFEYSTTKGVPGL